MSGAEARIAIVGGSGLYEMAGAATVREVAIDTPFGEPSDRIRIGTLAGKPVAFLARHGRDHTLLPGEINFRANIFALKRLGVERILSASAVGSMREQVRPRDVVLVDQFIDRTQGRPSTFFGRGLVAHVSLADPVCPELRGTLVDASERFAPQAHDGGTYVCIEGPAFSTRAESELYRGWDVDVIGMTNLPEARLAREAEICYATLALVTDYDCWHADEEDVNVSAVLDNLKANSATAGKILAAAVETLPAERGRCSCGGALAHAILTRLDRVPEETRQRLAPLVARYLGGDSDGS